MRCFYVARSPADAANDWWDQKMQHEGSFVGHQRSGFQAAVTQALRVLFVTEGPATNTLADYFRSAGLSVDVMASGRRGPSAQVCSTYDALLIHQSASGRAHPKRLISLLQGKECPGILVLASSSGEADKIEALELGADDYQVIGCRPRELLARIRAVARRRPSRFVPAPSSAIGTEGELRSGYSFGGWFLDVWNGRMTSPEGIPIRLTMSEAKILMAILGNPNSVIIRAHLTKVLGRFDADGSYRPIDLFVSRLRKKLAAYDAAEIIVTERGAGYAYNHTLGRVESMPCAA